MAANVSTLRFLRPRRFFSIGSLLLSYWKSPGPPLPGPLMGGKSGGGYQPTDSGPGGG